MRRAAARGFAMLAVAAGRYGAFAVIIAAWAVASEYLKRSGAPDYILPSPLSVVAEAGLSIGHGELPSYLSESLVHLAFAGTSGLVLGMTFGLVVGLNRWAARFFYPLANFFQSIGGIAITPLIIIWFGFTLTGLIVAVNYTVFFPVAFNTLIGVATVPPVYVNAARTLGASQVQIVRDVIVPGAMPNILLGTRHAFAYAWRALVAVEMLLSLDGLGFMLFDARQFLNTPKIIVGMLVLGVIVVLIDQVIIKPLEALTIQRWGMVQR